MTPPHSDQWPEPAPDSEMKRFWSRRLRWMEAYEAGEQPQDRTYIKLNTNENPYPPAPQVLAALKSVTADQLRLYPDPGATALKDAIARYYRLDSNTMVFAGNGSDEVLAHAFLAFFDQSDPVLFPDISYSFYPVYCARYAIRYRQVPLTDQFDIDTGAYPVPNGGVVFPNPNAPTGKYIPPERIRELLERCRESVVLIDEAYIDFGGASCIPLVREYPNLLVTQTLSKSRSLAALRVGFAIGQPDLITALEVAKNSFNSYPLGTAAIAAAVAAFSDRPHFERQAGRIIEIREWVAVELQQLGFEVIPSQANFLLIRYPGLPGEALYQTLKDQGILVRHFQKPRIIDYVRVTIGTGEDMGIFLEKLKVIIA